MKSIWEFLKLKTASVKQLVSSDMWGLVIVLNGYGSDNRLKVWKRVECMVFHSDRKHLHLHQRLLPAIYDFLILSDRGSMIAIAIIHVHALGRQEEIKIFAIYTRLVCLFGLGHSLNRLNDQVRGKHFWWELQEWLYVKIERQKIAEL